MGNHPTAYEQDDESDNTYQNYNTYHHVIVTVNFSLRIDKAYVPTGIIQGATWNNGTNEGFIEHITVDTMDTESLHEEQGLHRPHCKLIDVQSSACRDERYKNRRCPAIPHRN